MKNLTIEEKRTAIKEFIEMAEDILSLDNNTLDEIMDAETTLSFISTTGQMNSVIKFLKNRESNKQSTP